MQTTELQVDVTEAAGLGEPAHIALTVTAPEGRRHDTWAAWVRAVRESGRGGTGTR